MDYIKIRDAAALINKPERTLRHLLAQGKLIGRKTGQTWLVETASLRKAGYLNDMIKLISDPSAPLPPPNASPLPEQRLAEPRRKKQTPRDFGLYQALLQLRGELSRHAAKNPKLIIWFDEALETLAAGYFEYSKPIKCEYYREARCRIAKLWCAIDVLLSNDGSRESSLALIHDKLAADIIPGFAGALKKFDSESSFAKRYSHETQIPSASETRRMVHPAPTESP